MVKVSVIMPVYNAEDFLDDSINSILNQTLSDLELICADDGSTDNSLKLLYDYAKKDNRVKVIPLEHYGGGNARNYALTQVTGEYLYIMDADDILDLNAFERFYLLSKSMNLDFIIFKAINYNVDEDYYYETEYYNMSRLANQMKDEIFNFKTLGKLIFNINVTPWCKFYNTQFIMESGAKFRENSKFHDNQFFWDIIFQAERIYFLDEFYYIRTRHSESLTASGDENHMNILGVVNDIFDLFRKHGEFENYKSRLYNRKIDWIIPRYEEIKEEYKELFFTELKKDFESQGADFADNMWGANRFTYDAVLISDNHNDFDLLQNYVKILGDDELTLDDKISSIEKWYNSLSDRYKSYYFKKIKSDFEKYENKKISSENHLFYNAIVNSTNFNDFVKNPAGPLKMKLDSILIKEREFTQYIKQDMGNYDYEFSSKFNDLNLFIEDIYKQMISDLTIISDDYYSQQDILQKLESDMLKKENLVSNLNKDFNNFKSLNILKDRLISDLNGTIKDFQTKVNDNEYEMHENENLIKEFRVELDNYKSLVSKSGVKLSKLTSENKYLIKKNEELNKTNLDLMKKLNEKNKSSSFFKKS